METVLQNWLTVIFVNIVNRSRNHTQNMECLYETSKLENKRANGKTRHCLVLNHHIPIDEDKLLSINNYIENNITVTDEE